MHTGQSSLLQGLIGEMRRVRGHVSFGGKVAYCSQTAWIQNATLVRTIAVVVGEYVLTNIFTERERAIRSALRRGAGAHVCLHLYHGLTALPVLESGGECLSPS